jgi:hypothetical protein
MLGKDIEKELFSGSSGFSLLVFNWRLAEAFSMMGPEEETDIMKTGSRGLEEIMKK